MPVVDDLIDAVRELREYNIFHGPDLTECSVPDYFIWNILQKLQKYEAVHDTTEPAFVAGDTERCGAGTLSNLG